MDSLFFCILSNLDRESNNLIDYHIHTRLCKHAVGEIEEYIVSALKKGIKEIAFTDHIPLPDNFDIEHRMSPGEIDIYLNRIESVKTQYPELTILTGIEADYYEGIEKYLDNFLNSFDFDLVIMSVHFLSQWGDGNWVFSCNFPDKSEREIYEDYFAAQILGVETGLFDIIGHIDLIKQPGKSLLAEAGSYAIELLLAIKKAGMVIEINSSGFRKNVNEPFPGFDWIGSIKKHQIGITTGSDAHTPDQVGLQFYQVYSFLNQNGYRSIKGFRKRKAFDINIDFNLTL